MTLETEKYDPVKTHWVRIVIGRVSTFKGREELEETIETAFTEMNSRAIKEGMVILSISQACVNLSDYDVCYTLTAQIISRQVLEQQQMRQRLSHNS